MAYLFLLLFFGIGHVVTELTSVLLLLVLSLVSLSSSQSRVVLVLRSPQVRAVEATCGALVSIESVCCVVR